MKIKKVIIFLLPLLLISIMTKVSYNAYDNYYKQKILSREIIYIDNSFRVNSYKFETTIDNIYSNIEAINSYDVEYNANDIDVLKEMFNSYLNYGYSNVVITDLDGFGCDNNFKDINLSNSTTYLLTKVRGQLVTDKSDIYHLNEEIVVCKKFDDYIVYLVAPVAHEDFSFINEGIFTKGSFAITSNDDEVLFANDLDINWLFGSSEVDETKFSYFDRDIANTGIKLHFVISNQDIIANSNMNTVNIKMLFTIIYLVVIFVYGLFVIASNKYKKDHVNESHIGSVFESSKLGVGVFTITKTKPQLVYYNNEFSKVFDLHKNYDDNIYDEIKCIFTSATTLDEEFENLYCEAEETGNLVFCVTKIINSRNKYTDCLIQLQIINNQYIIQAIEVDNIIFNHNKRLINASRIDAILTLSNISSLEFNLTQNTVKCNLVFDNSKRFVKNLLSLNNGKTKFENVVSKIIGEDDYCSYLKSIEHEQKYGFKCVREFDYQLFGLENRLIIINEQYNGEEFALVYAIHGDQIVIDDIKNEKLSKLLYLKSTREFNEIVKKDNTNATLLLLITKNNLKPNELIKDIECVYNCFKDEIEEGICYITYDQKIAVYFTETIKIIRIKKSVYEMNAIRLGISDFGIAYSKDKGYYEMYRECNRNIESIELF